MIDIVSLIQSRGITLTKQGSHYLGQCPHHDNAKPDSLIVDSKDNTFVCDTCDLIGDPVLFISKFDGISLNHAKDLISNGGALIYQHKDTTPKVSTVPVLPCPLGDGSEGNDLLNEVVDYYHQHLLTHQPALDYLTKHGVWNEDLIRRFKIGFADRSLGLRLPSNTRVAGKTMRSRLVDVGIYRSTGHAHFNGCVVVPVVSVDGVINNLYGRRIQTRGSKSKNPNLTLNDNSHVFNNESLNGRKLILCDTVMDTLTFLSCGFENALCVVGDEVLSMELLECIKTRRIDSVHLALSSTEEGEVKLLQGSDKLKKIGVSVYQIKFPWGMDANDVLVKHGKDELIDLHRNAIWLGAKSKEVTGEGVSKIEPTREVLPTTNTVDKPKTNIEKVGDYYHISLGDVEYRVGGLDKNNSMDVMKVTLRVSCDGLIHIDHVDLYKDSDRRKFIDRANEECLLDKTLLKRDLGKILIMLESEMEQRIYHTEVDSKPTIKISDEDRSEALELLKSPDLLQKVETIFDDIGLQGERSNKMVAFLSMVSRLLPKCLGVVIQNSSASGKSFFMDQVLSLFPDNEKLVFSSLTGQALYYQKSLKNKILGISEDVGFERAGESLKLLQSQGYLSISTTSKDTKSGKMVSQDYHVEGPIALIFTTTSIDLNEELINRCLVLNLSESESVTKSIQDQQRQSQTLDGYLQKEQRKKVQHLMQIAQLLLKPYTVINEYAPHLTFTTTRSRSRRDHDKYLQLLSACATLRQHQKKLKVVTLPSGEEVEYIEVDLVDIEYVNGISGEVFGKTLSELPPQTQKLLDVCKSIIKNKKEESPSQDHTFTRKEVRDVIGWSEYQVRTHVQKLQNMEYILKKSGGVGSVMEYVLLVDCSEDALELDVGLVNVEDLKKVQI